MSAFAAAPRRGSHLHTVQSGNAPRPTGAPAPTILGNGWHKWTDGRAEVPRADSPIAVRIAVVEAAVLQSFPVDYPWQGTKGEQHRQVGDAVPPTLARAVVAAVSGLAVVDDAAAA